MTTRPDGESRRGQWKPDAQVEPEGKGNGGGVSLPSVVRSDNSVTRTETR
jgi:hypothetical protein